MGELIDDLLAFSRMGRAEIVGISIRLGDLVRDVIRSLEMATRDRAIVWQMADLPAVVGDAGLVKQVLTNLLSNALKFVSASGQVVVTCQRLDDDIRFEVRDTGIGIPAEMLVEIFDRFRQVKIADRRGVGLGLPVDGGLAVGRGLRVDLRLLLQLGLGLQLGLCLGLQLCLGLGLGLGLSVGGSLVENLALHADFHSTLVANPTQRAFGRKSDFDADIVFDHIAGKAFTDDD